MFRLVVICTLVTASMPRVLFAQDVSPKCRADLEGCYRGTDGRLRDADAAYDAMLGTPDPSYVRASVEMLLSLGLGALWYWLDKEHNLADWDNPSFRQRLSTDIWRFDNNNFAINWIFHPLSGSAWYALARGNEINVPWSATYSFVTSMLWEYVLEFREKISINDVLVTPAAGITIGEFTNKLGVYLNSAPPQGRWLLQTLRWALGWTVAGHRALDGKSASEPVETDSLGLNADTWHQFRLGYRSQLLINMVDHLPLLHSFHAEGELVSIPGFLREGRFGRGLVNADFTQLEVSVYLSGKESGLNLYSDTTLFGYYAQDIGARGSGLWGYGFLVGSSLAYRYLNQGAPYRDRLGILHFPGLAANYYWLFGRARLRVKARGHFDFAGVHASGFSEWQEDNPDEVPKSILKKQGYYYGWGGSGRVMAELSLWPFELGGSVFFGMYNSDEGLDRAQGDVTADVKASDTVLEYAGWLRFQFGNTMMHIELGTNGRRRSSKIGRLSKSIRDDRYTVGLIMQF